MFGGSINIQNRPTITLYEKKAKTGLLLQTYPIQTYALREVYLGTPIVDVYNLVTEANQTYGLREFILGDPVINIDLAEFPELNSTYGLTDFDLHETVVNLSSFTLRPSQTYSLRDFTLATVVKNIGGTRQIGPTKQTYGLSSFILA